MSTATKTTRTVSDRVAAGVEFLDAHIPGWDARINLSTLELSSSCGCVLGQLFDGGDVCDPYATGCEALGLSHHAERARGFWDDIRAEISFDHLTAEWRRVITERRSAA